MTLRALSLAHTMREPRTPLPGLPPLLVLLHGVGSHERDLIGLADTLDSRFLVASARAPITLGADAYGWYPVQWTQQGPQHSAAEADAGRVAASRFVAEVVQAYGADPARVYLLGFSQGAIMSLGIALTEPEQVAGAVIMSGRLLPEVTAQRASRERLRDLPLLVVHGTRDAVLPVSCGREIAAALSALPVELTYAEFDMAHQVSDESLHLISTWLTAQLDNPEKLGKPGKVVL